MRAADDVRGPWIHRLNPVELPRLPGLASAWHDLETDHVFVSFPLALGESYFPETADPYLVHVVHHSRRAHPGEIVSVCGCSPGARCFYEVETWSRYLSRDATPERRASFLAISTYEAIRERTRRRRAAWKDAALWVLGRWGRKASWGP